MLISRVKELSRLVFYDGHQLRGSFGSFCLLLLSIPLPVSVYTESFIVFFLLFFLLFFIIISLFYFIFTAAQIKGY